MAPVYSFFPAQHFWRRRYARATYVEEWHRERDGLPRLKKCVSRAPSIFGMADARSAWCHRTAPTHRSAIFTEKAACVVEAFC